MSDNDNERPRAVDAGRPRGGLFDRDEGYSGQEYNQADAERQLAEGPSGTVDPDASEAGDRAADPDAPPERGQRASFDPASGEVLGSGSGAGGGKIGEDYASDPATGADGGRHIAALSERENRE